MRAPIRSPTRDLVSRAAAEASRHPVYTVEQIGPNRHRLKNGNLLCTNVPLARAGWLVYGAGEVPVAPGAGGVAYVQRTADALFRDDTLRSFLGAAVTNDHPREDVTPANWARHAGGYVIAVRQGAGDDADVVLGDIMVTREDLIRDIEAGKVEVSAGYDADYQDQGSGLGLQDRIIVNHIALVQRGRCGPRCSIGDAAFQTNPERENDMPQANTPARGRRRATIDEAALAALRERAQDAVAALEAAEDESEDDAVHVHIHGGPQEGAGARTTDAETQGRVEALEAGLERVEALMEAVLEAVTAKTGDAATQTPPAIPGTNPPAQPPATPPAQQPAAAAEGDSKALHASYQEMTSAAEVLVPGFKVPTFDAAASRASTVDRMCSARRLCLSQFATADAGAAMLRALSGGADPDIVSMPCDAAAVLFSSAAAAKGAANNAAAVAGAGAATRDAAGQGQADIRKGPASLAEMNEINRKFWEGK